MIVCNINKNISEVYLGDKSISEVYIGTNKVFPEENDYVEIGGLKWATKNIGANSITDTGLYFQWGDTQGYTADQVRRGQKNFDWEDYKYASGSTAADITKYNSSDGKTVLEASDDAAQANWGGQWRMPTRTDYDNLLSATTNEWVTINGVKGCLFTSKTDASKTLFFPACGTCNSGVIYDVGIKVGYWSSSLQSSTNVVFGSILYFNSSSGEGGSGYGNGRMFGNTIRAVRNS